MTGLFFVSMVHSLALLPFSSPARSEIVAFDTSPNVLDLVSFL
jgi:hypothetical protein